MIKKTILIFFAMFILCITVIPVFATEATSANITCEQHIVNYPATPVYTHEVGIDIYHCANCSHEMWRCEECNQYMSIDEVQCTECGEFRNPFNSSEETQIDILIQDKKADTLVCTMLIIITVFCIAAISWCVVNICL